MFIFIQLMNFSCNNEDQGLQAAVQNLILKTFQSSQAVLESCVVNSIRKRLQQCVKQQYTILEVLEFYIYSLISNLQGAQQKITTQRKLQIAQLKLKDYIALETSLQKAQNDIRQHIRIQQELKIYLDQLQEKNQILKKQFKAEKEKYQKLFENLSAIDDERKQLRRQLRKYENKSKLSEKKFITQISKPQKVTSGASIFQQYLSHGKTNYHQYLPKKKRSIVQKINERSRKLSKKLNSNTKLLQCPLIVKFDDEVMQRQTRENFRNVNQLQQENTVEIKQQSKANKRKIGRYSTEEKCASLQKKNVRSASVLN